MQIDSKAGEKNGSLLAKTVRAVPLLGATAGDEVEITWISQNALTTRKISTTK